MPATGTRTSSSADLGPRLGPWREPVAPAAPAAVAVAVTARRRRLADRRRRRRRPRRRGAPARPWFPLAVALLVAAGAGSGRPGDWPPCPGRLAAVLAPPWALAPCWLAAALLAVAPPRRSPAGGSPSAGGRERWPSPRPVTVAGGRRRAAAPSTCHPCAGLPASAALRPAARRGLLSAARPGRGTGPGCGGRPLAGPGAPFAGRSPAAAAPWRSWIASISWPLRMRAVPVMPRPEARPAAPRAPCRTAAGGALAGRLVGAASPVRWCQSRRRCLQLARQPDGPVGAFVADWSFHERGWRRVLPGPRQPSPGSVAGDHRSHAALGLSR